MAKVFPMLYRVLMTSVDCLAKRAVSFQTEDPLTWDEVNDEAYNHFYSQTCSRCLKDHCDKHYVATDIDEGQPDLYGNYSWREVKKERAEYDYQPELDLHGY